MIVAFGAGGSTDVGARLLATELEEELGTTVVVENRDGGGGQVGYNTLVQAEADGYTLATTSASAIVGPLDPNVNASYTADDFAPVARIVFDPVVVAVKEDSPYSTLEDLLDDAEQNPDTLTVSQVGPTASDALLRYQLEEASGAKFSVVSYPDGASSATTALLGGDLDVLVGNVGDVTEFEGAGQLRVLAVAGEERSPFLPDVPTFGEHGFEIVVGSSRGFAFPGGTPDAIVDEVSDAIARIMEDPEFVQQMEDSNLQAAFMNADEYQAFWASETEVWAETIPLLLESEG